MIACPLPSKACCGICYVPAPLSEVYGFRGGHIDLLETANLCARNALTHQSRHVRRFAYSCKSPA